MSGSQPRTGHLQKPLTRMRSPTPSPFPHRRYKKAWSPAPSDPRYSRCTPDRLHARLNLKRPINAIIGNASSWACNILYAKARKLPTCDPKRKQIISLMMRKADAVEIATVAPQEVVKVDTPSGAPLLALQETAALMQHFETRCETADLCCPCVARLAWE